MEKIKIQVQTRDVVGKETAKKVRRQGSVPAIVYGKDLNIPVVVLHESLKLLRSINFSESTIIDMEIANEKKKDTHAAIIKNVQYHPLTEEIIHIDFLKVSLKDKIKVRVSLDFKGEAKGIKDGGVFEQVLRELEIEGFPLDVPEKIEVDVSGLELGRSLHVRDIKVADNLKVITSFEETVATVSIKKEEEVVAPEIAEAPQEPEVIREKKEPKEAEAAEAEEKGKKEEKQKEEKKEEKQK